MKRILVPALLSLTGLTGGTAAETLASPEIPKVDQSLFHEARASILRGKDFLLAQQQGEGNFSSTRYPAISGLALWALALNDGAADLKVAQGLDKGVDFIISKAHPSGAIFDQQGGLRNYNTNLGMLGLHMSGLEKARPYVLKAREYVAKSQHSGDDLYKGGFGYDAELGRNYSDGINTFTAIESWVMTASAEDHRKEGKSPTIDKSELVKFIDRLKNDPSINKDSPFATDRPSEKGGHFYKPDDNRAGSFTNAVGVVKFNSYGSMTYAAMLSYIYADLKPDDHRVKSAYRWAMDHWTLAENPGTGQQGLYYYINVMTKGLNVMGKDVVKTKDGREVHWRSEVIKRLIELQKQAEAGNVMWVNEKDRWMEGDPVLVSSYTLIALQNAIRGVTPQ